MTPADAKKVIRGVLLGCSWLTMAMRTSLANWSILTEATASGAAAPEAVASVSIDQFAREVRIAIVNQLQPNKTPRITFFASAGVITPSCQGSTNLWVYHTEEPALADRT